MSYRQVLSFVGYAIDIYVTEGSDGGYFGALLGGAVGGAIDASNAPGTEVPKVGDLKAPQMQYGSKLPRLYGSNRTSGTLAWYSAKRVIPGEEGGGKGDEPSPGTPDTADIDVLYILAIDSPIVGLSRVWRNGELVWSRRAGSDPATLTASSQHWGDIRFLDGNPLQMPDPTIEASEGLGNVSAYRHRQCVLIDSLHLGQSGLLPVMEFECITHADANLAGPTRLQSYFERAVADDTTDWGSTTPSKRLDFALYRPDLPGGIAAPAMGVGWYSYISSGQTATGNSELIVGWPGVAPDITLAKTWNYASTSIAPNGTDPVTIEFYGRLVEFTDPREGTDPQKFALMSWHPNSSGAGAGHGDVYDFSYNAAGQIIYADNTDPGTYATPSPTPGRTHLALVFGASSFRVYVAGVKVLERAGSAILPLVSGAEASIQFGSDDGLLDLITIFGTLKASAELRIDEFAIRFEETYTGDRFIPPRRIRRPDLYLDAIAPLPVNLSEIVQTEWRRVGDTADIDTTDLEGIYVRGFQTGGSVRSSLEALSAIYHFGATCSDKLYFRKQGGAIAATIPYGDLAAAEDEAAAEPFVPERGNIDEIAQRVALTYSNFNDDYANGTETGDRGAGDSTATTSVSTNVVMTSSEAKKVAEVFATQAAIAATTGQVSVGDFYAALEPTDRIQVPDEDGNLYEMRITRETYAAGVRQFDLVRDGGAFALVSAGITSDTGTIELHVTPPPAATLLLLDIPMLRDVDDNPGFYAAEKGSSAAVLFASPDDVTYTATETTFTAQTTFGDCTTTLPDWTGGRVFDERSRLTVDVGARTLSSATRAAILADQATNACAIGIDGRWELCQFRTATLISTGVYVLSGFLRGSRGTEWASTGHGSGETFALLGPAMRRVARDSGDIGVVEFYKGVTPGGTVATADTVTFTDNAIGKKPFAPVHLRRGGPDGSAVLTWQRRTRLSTRFGSALGISAPLDEPTEAYDLELRDGGGALLSTATSSTNTWTGDVTGAASVTVYQRSPVVGRGYPATLSL